MVSDREGKHHICLHTSVILVRLHRLAFQDPVVVDERCHLSQIWHILVNGGRAVRRVLLWTQVVTRNEELS